jgi:hypothetical protein
VLLPEPRGPISSRLGAHLLEEQPLEDVDVASIRADVGRVVDPLTDEDVQLSLAVLHELHHRGFDDVDDAHEWDPPLVAVRVALERAVEEALRDETAPALAAVGTDAGTDTTLALRALVDRAQGPSLSAWMRNHAGVEHYRELLALRSVYHLREADPQTWAIPRLHGRAKSALLEIQCDEYGNGRPGRMHSELFARSMAALGLDPTYGAYWAKADATALSIITMMTTFGLNRRLRGASMGQLAAVEMTSSLPNGALAAGLRRLGLDGDATWFFDEHVEADAVHEQIAMVDLAQGLVAAEPELRDDVLFGAASYLALEDRFARRLIDRWTAEGRRTDAA